MKSSELLIELTTVVESIIQTVEQEFIHLSESNLNWKENSERWSVLECIEHLNRYNRFYNPEFKKSLATVERNVVLNPEPKSTWLGKKFIAMMHPNNAKKQKTLKHMNPINSTLKKSILTEFLSHQKDLLTILNHTKNTNLNKGKVPVEFLRLLKMNLGDGLQFVIVHEQRHINQAMAVLSKQGAFTEPPLKV